MALAVAKMTQTRIVRRTSMRISCRQILTRDDQRLADGCACQGLLTRATIRAPASRPTHKQNKQAFQVTNLRTARCSILLSRRLGRLDSSRVRRKCTAPRHLPNRRSAVPTPRPISPAPWPCAAVSRYIAAGNVLAQGTQVGARHGNSRPGCVSPQQAGGPRSGRQCTCWAAAGGAVNRHRPSPPTAAHALTSPPGSEPAHQPRFSVQFGIL